MEDRQPVWGVRESFLKEGEPYLSEESKGARGPGPGCGLEEDGI